MKITKQQLKQIIEEEYAAILLEYTDPVPVENPFSQAGQRAARRSPSEVTGPAQIIQVKNGESLPLANVEAGETVMVRFEEV
tara:strand:+ start:744 stop:989 length:246 start_codon:yes stop_codon:yes gene_type:complete